MEDENFRQELEDLFRMFKRLMEKESLDELSGVDPQQLEKLKQFMAQFDDVKDKIKIDMVHVDPFTKMMISSVVKQLREQLGDELDELDELGDYDQVDRISAEEIVNQREELLKDVTDETARYRSLIETIDEQLRNPDLSDDEIDALLDKRTQISNKLSQI
jgi:hypothetical protein